MVGYQALIVVHVRRCQKSIQFESDVNASDILIDEWVISGEGGKNLVFTSSGECAP